MFCPICLSQVQAFTPMGKRANAKCPVCKSLERHRYTWVLLEERSPLMDGAPKRILEFGPAPSIAARIRQIPGVEYVTADLYNERGAIKMDIRDIRFPDASFDMVMCSHVLEHVVEDRLAISELYRVLKPGGYALIAVPVTTQVTFEDPSAITDEDRVRLYGIKDHVRRYGFDFPDRLREVGFEVITPDRDTFVPKIFMQLSNMASKGIELCRR